MSVTAQVIAAAGSLVFPFGGPVPAKITPQIEILGGKGVNLAKLTTAGFPVPPGIVITTDGYRRFVDEHKLESLIREALAGLNPADAQSIEAASRTIRSEFESRELPADLAQLLLSAYAELCRHANNERLAVAVRSSATAEDLEEAAFAGQQDTFLNVRGEAALLQAVRACWSSLWTGRAITYRAAKNFGIDGLALAVVIQKMVLSDASGVMFTVNPVSGARGEIVINAAWGLGEAIVSGRVTPDTIVVDKHSGTLKEVAIADKRVMTARIENGIEERELSDEMRHKRVLDDAAVARLVAVGRAVETHYNAPQDIEWCLEQGVIYVVQARPVTALPPEPILPQDIEDARQAEIKRVQTLAGQQPMVFAVHNLAETLTAPTPLSWDVVRDFMRGDGGFGAMYRDFGYQPSAEVCKNGFLELLCGRIYIDPRRAAGLFSSDMPMEYDLDAVRQDPRVLDSAPTKLNLQSLDPFFFLRLPWVIVKSLRSGRRLNRARRTALSDFQKHALPQFLEYVEAAHHTDLVDLDTGRLLAELERRSRIVLHDFLKESLKPGFFGGLAQTELQALLVQLMGDQRGEELTRLLTTGLENDTTIEQSIALDQVAHNKQSLADFLQAYGHRSINEMELAQPRWREDPEPLKKMLGAYRAPGAVSPHERHQKQVAARHQAEAALPEQLAEAGGAAQRETVLQLLQEAQQLLPYRESAKHYLMMGYETVRAIYVELGRRWQIGQDVFFLQHNELPRFEAERGVIEPQLRARRLHWRACQKLFLPALIDSTQLEKLGCQPERKPIEGKLHMPARPIAAGIGRGTARIVFDPAEAGDIGSDYVLVCPSTDPGWTPLFVNARALIVERGGVLSHGAIVARDFGIPAVVCENATQIIPAGRLIEIDGDRGLITEVE